MTVDESRWLYPAAADPDAALRLFLFHHSGGSAAMYAGWLRPAPSDLAVQCVQLPGRQDRRDEAPYTMIGPLAAALAEVLGSEVDDRPYALFGHSLGALVAYRVAATLAAEGWPCPALVAVSGWAPVGATLSHGSAGQLSDEKLLAAMHRLGGLPPEIRARPGLLALTIQALRADLGVCDSYQDDGWVIPCPIVAFSGRDDPLVPPGAMRAWASRTPSYLGNREFPGGHFFLHERSQAIMTDLVSLLRRYAAGEDAMPPAPFASPRDRG